jgi:hypothetical protein
VLPPAETEILTCSLQNIEQMKVSVFRCTSVFLTLYSAWSEVWFLNEFIWNSI